jgi:hypothetical protein
MSRAIAIAAMLLFSASAHALSAQDGPARLSVDGAVGGGHGWRGGPHVERGLIAADLLAAVRLRGDTRRSFVIAFEVSRDWQLNGDLLCLSDPVGACLPEYPGFAALNAVAGYQWHSAPALRVRVLGGPGYYTTYLDHHSTTMHSVGVGARTDIAVQLFRPVSATITGRAGWIPRIRGESYVPGALMIGLRLETGG